MKLGAPSTAAGASAAASATSTASRAAEVEDFGLEDQKAAEAKQKEQEQEQEAESGPVSIHSTVVTSKKSGLNHFVVGLDNGQIWEETDGSRRIGLPRIGTPVEVYKGNLGGYRMKFGGDNRVAWVRRLQ